VIVKRQFTPAAMWPYVRFDLALAAFASVAAWLLVQVGGVRQVALPIPSLTYSDHFSSGTGSMNASATHPTRCRAGGSTGSLHVDAAST